MGLDQYLKRKKYIGANYDWNNITGKIELYKKDKLIPIDLNKVSYIEEDVAYWRKANQIHKWFTDQFETFENCDEKYISTDELQELLNTCKTIKEKVVMKKGKVANGQRLTEDGWVDILEDGEYIENPEICEELLPTESGFFFGSTAYDQWYMQNIDYTIKMLEEILKEEEEYNNNGFCSDYYYTANW